MAQLSRPYQIALAAMAVLVLVWFVALHGHRGNPNEPAVSSSPSTPSSAGSASQAQSTAAAEERAAAKATPVYHGPAPGVEGLTRDIAKAHGAVALSQHKAAELRQKSAEASDEAATQKTPAVSGHGSKTHAGSGATASRGSRDTIHRHQPGVGTTAANAPKRPAQQAVVERELTHGKTVLLVFWNPKSSVDAAVRSQALAVGRGSKGKVAVHVARTGQVGLFGPVTEVAHVYETPTVLIVARHGLVSTLTGLIDDFGLQQAVREAEHAHK